MPERRGFGSRLIERLLAQDLNGRVRLAFDPEGVTCTVEAAVQSQ
jgi:two-component sensor histidine kinase